MNKFEVAKEFRDGVVCAIAVKAVPPEVSDHWTAGWVAGKNSLHEHLNAYLISIGMKPMGVITAAGDQK